MLVMTCFYQTILPVRLFNPRQERTWLKLSNLPLKLLSKGDPRAMSMRSKRKSKAF